MFTIVCYCPLLPHGFNFLYAEVLLELETRFRVNISAWDFYISLVVLIWTSHPHKMQPWCFVSSASYVLATFLNHDVSFQVQVCKWNDHSWLLALCTGLPSSSPGFGVSPLILPGCHRPASGVCLAWYSCGSFGLDPSHCVFNFLFVSSTWRFLFSISDLAL